MLTQEQLTMMAENVARIRENMAAAAVKPAATGRYSAVRRLQDPHRGRGDCQRRSAH